MRRLFGGFTAAAGLFLLILVPVWSAESKDDSRVETYVPPPRQLQNVNGHWTPYQPPVPPEGARVHVVEAGDCLSLLAQKYYQNPRLWPVIWDANRWITYSHWIYPGDPIVVPPSPTVVTEAGPPPAPAAVPEPAPQPIVQKPAPQKPAPPPGQEGPKLVPCADWGEMVCMGRMMDRMEVFPGQIVGTEEPKKELIGTGDVIFLDRGTSDGVVPGSVWLVQRPEPMGKKVRRHHPQPTFVRQLGLVRVIAVQESTSTAEVIFSCDSLDIGDRVSAFVEPEIPLIEPKSLPALFPEHQGRMDGKVVFVKDPRALTTATNDFVWIDLAASSGLSAGDRVLFWRPGEGPWPARLLGQGVVVLAAPGGSTVKVLEARMEIVPGDKAEVL